jgi:hypothetical protein
MHSSTTIPAPILGYAAKIGVNEWLICAGVRTDTSGCKRRHRMKRKDPSAYARHDFGEQFRDIMLLCMLGSFASLRMTRYACAMRL